MRLVRDMRTGSSETGEDPPILPDNPLRENGGLLYYRDNRSPRIASPAPGRARERLSMEKGMCYATLAIAVIMAAVFMLDMVAGVPFSGQGFGEFAVVDVFGLIASLVVGYLGFNSLRDIK